MSLYFQLVLDFKNGDPLSPNDEMCLIDNVSYQAFSRTCYLVMSLFSVDLLDTRPNGLDGFILSSD